MGSRAYDLWWGGILRATTVGHRALHSATGGRLGRRFPGGLTVVWVTTLGRRSGRWRTTPLLAVPDGQSWIVAGSNAGQAAVPGWVFNMRSHRDGRIEVDGVTSPARFDEVPAAEGAELYRRLVRGWSAYAMYERNARREIPVFRITPTVT
jgi:deazaflavin-dependent oxidoreductase (nitroreductase family)